MKINVQERLSDLLNEGVDVHRCAAARALGVIGGAHAVTDLTAALLDEDPDVRVDAATALAQIGDSATSEKLMENLVGDPDGDVKKVAITALVAMKHTPVIPLLRLLSVSRSEEEVAWDEDEFYESGWDSWDDIQLAAIRGLGDFADEGGVSGILTAMADEMGQDVSEPAFYALSQMGATGARALTSMFELGDTRLNRRIARAVGKSDNAQLDDLRAVMLDDMSANIRALAVANLTSDNPRIEGMFADGDALVRAAAVRHHGGANLAVLRDMITDDAPEVRIEVFKTIAKNPEAFTEKADEEAIKGTLKGDPEAAKHAALALFALKGPKVAKGFTYVLAKQDVPREFRIGVLQTLEKSGEVAVPALASVAGDPDRQLRLASLTVLANIAAADPAWPNDAGKVLLSALKGELVLPPEEEPEEEEVAPEPAPEPDAAELEEIEREIDESLPLVAEDVAEGSTLRAIMDNTPNAPVSEPEEVVLNPEQERMLEMTKKHSFSKRKVTWLTEVAPYLDVQRFSARLMAQVVRPETTEALAQVMLGDQAADIDDETRDAVLFSLAVHGEKGAALPEELKAPLLALVKGENSETRVLAMRVLGWLGSNDIPAELEAALKDADPLVRVEAVQALANRNIAGAPLRAALHDGYLGVSIAAARALARIEGDTAVRDLVDFAVRNDGTYRRDIGRLLGQYAPVSGAVELLELLNDEDRKAMWLVAIDALAELFKHQDPDQDLLVA